MMRLGVLAYPVTAPADWPTYAAKINALVTEGAAAGAHLLLMPEYACMETAAFHAGAGDAAAELQAVCALAENLLALFTEAACRHEIWLLPGTMPWRDPTTGAIHNRAPLIAPDGTADFQYKSVMTRFETERWGVQAGAPPRIFETPWGKLGIAICYDSEFPTLVRTQTRQGAWLILVPSCTDSLHGFNRVRLSARARALENQCYVAVSPTVGAAPALATLDENQGYAAIFGPVDRGFPPDGIIARGDMNTPGWIFADLDPERLTAVREGGAVRNFRDWPDEKEPRPMNANAAETLIRSYYDAFNARDWTLMLSLLTDTVAHDINQGARETGREAFAAFLRRMDASYAEHLADIAVMTNPSGTRAAAEFTVHGTYIKADPGLPMAHGQTYVLPAGAFFDIAGGHIARVSNYYNLEDWIRQVS